MSKATSSHDDRDATTGGVVVIDHLSKNFGHVHAVDDLSFTVHPGRVTGFLGPNGAGKTTTLRILLGLVSATAGTATIGGSTYGHFVRPMRSVGAALEAANIHPGRSALDHLRVYAPQAGVSDARCREVLDLVGLGPVARRRVGGFSLGMRQRLALATTLLGDPPVLLLDEPANGLDPEGIAWLRVLLRHLASEGRTVLVSSHVLSEVEQTVDDVVIIAKGRLGALLDPRTARGPRRAERSRHVARRRGPGCPDHGGRLARSGRTGRRHTTRGGRHPPRVGARDRG